MFIAKSQAAGNLGTLTEWHQTDGYTGLRNELARLYGGQYAAEIVASIIEEADPHPELFDAMAALLASLAGGGDTLPLLVGFQSRVLESVGLWRDRASKVVDPHRRVNDPHRQTVPRAAYPDPLPTVACRAGT